MDADEALRILGLSASATRAEIKAAFRRLVKASHPDRGGAGGEPGARAEDTLQRVVEAYRCLRNGVPPEPAVPLHTTRPGWTTPFANQRRSRRRRSPRRRLRTALARAAVIGTVLLSAGMFVLGEYPSHVDDVGTQVADAPTFWNRWVPVRASRVGDGWQIQNPTGRMWRNCTAWVGGSRLSIAEVPPGAAPLALSAGQFTPSLDAGQAPFQLELMCPWP